MIRAVLISFVMCFASPVFAQSVTAILEPVNQVEIRSAVNGRLADILVTEGQVVAIGAVLAKIDARVQEARVALAQLAAESSSAVDRADVAIAQAQALRDRIVRARSKGAAQKWEVIQAEQNLQLAQADRVLAIENNAQAQGQLSLEQAILSEFTMRAPFDGTILQVFSDVGEIVDTQMTVIEIGNMTNLEATAFVPLDWLDWLRADGPTRVSVQGLDREIKGRVTSIDPRVDPASLSVRIKVAIDNEELGILAGTPVSILQP